MTIFRKTKKKQAQPAPTIGSAAPRRGGKAHGARIAYRTLIRSHVTEKAGHIAHENQYVFRVADRATKHEIAQAVREVYGVRPIRVSTIRIPRKRRRLGRTEGWISGYKKAIVTLPQGKTMEVLPR